MQDDAVTEYDFDNEKDSGFEDDEDEDENPRGIFKDTLHDVIEISSDDGAPQDDFALDPKPWRNMNPAERRELEKRYCEQMARPLDGDWERAESYQEHLDLEMEESVPFLIHWIMHMLTIVQVHQGSQAAGLVDRRAKGATRI